MAATYPKDFILYDVSHDEVYLTGSWCDWRPNAIKMTKIPNLYFIATVQLPFETKVAYKYIVGNTWMTNPEEQSETDAAGNTNNVFQTPSQADHHATTSASSPRSGSQGVFSSSAPKSTGAAPTAVGGAVASTGVAADAAHTAHAVGLGQSESGGATGVRSTGPAPVPVGGAVASTGIAEDAAHTAAINGLGESETSGVTGVEKVAPGVTQAVAGGSGVNDKDLAKPDIAKAPLPASTGDAPLAPGQTEHEGKGLFAVIGGLGAAAAATAYKAAIELEHKIEEKIEGKSTAVPTTASPTTSTTAPAAATGTTGSFATTSNAGTTAPALAASSHKEPVDALKGITTNDATARITHDLKEIDFQHTKAEVVGAVERFGEVLAGGLTGIGASHEGRDIPPMDDFWAKKASASASSAFGKSLHDADANPAAFSAAHSSSAAPTGLDRGALATTGSSSGVTSGLSKDAPAAQSLPPVTGGPELYPTDGKTAPQAIKISEPEKDVSHVQKEASATGADAPAQTGSTTGTTSTTTAEDGKKPGLMQKLKAEIKGEPVAANKETEPAAAAKTADSQPASKTAGASSLGVGQAPASSATGSSAAATTSAEAPVTPKKGAATSAATPNSDGYKTAPTTPAGKDGDRKRKSSFFHKIKSALSPSK